MAFTSASQTVTLLNTDVPDTDVPDVSNQELKLDRTLSNRISVSDAVMLTHRHEWDPTRVIQVRLDDVVAALDDSGSTQGRIFDREMAHVGSLAGAVVGGDHVYGYAAHREVICTRPMILWSCQARKITPGNRVNLNCGGTSPSSIWTNTDCKQLVESKSVFVISTDGEIGNHEVKCFAAEGSEILNSKQLVVGVLYPERVRCRPGEMNISVVAALMALGPNCLILVDHENTLRLLYARGDELRSQLETLGLAPPVEIDEATDWHDLPEAESLSALLTQLKFCRSRPPVPAGHFLVRSGTSFIETAQHDTLREATAESLLHKLEDLMAWDWNVIVDSAKVTGTMYELRHTVKDIQSKVVPLLEVQAQSQKTDPQSRKRKSTMAHLARIIATESFDSPEQARKLKLKFALFMQEEKVARAQEDKALNLHTRPARHFFQDLLSKMSAVEQAGWAMQDRAGSNRAQRAGQVEEVDMADLVQTILDSELKCLQMECQICCQQGSAVLLLNPSDDDEFYETDFAIDSPLACGHKAGNKICNFHVCLDCAKFFWGQHKDMYHRPVLAVLPVFLPNQKAPKDLWYKLRTLLMHAFVGGKNLHHVMLLMFGALESLGSQQWSRSDEWAAIRNAMTDFLASCITTTPMFDQWGDRVLLKEAFLTLFQDETAFSARPTAMQLITLRMVHRFHADKLPSVQKLLLNSARIALAYAVVGRFKTAQPELAQFTNFLHEQTYQHTHGLVVRGTLVARNPHSPELWNRVFGTAASALRGSFKHLQSVLPFLTPQDIFPKEAWTYFLHALCYYGLRDPQLLVQRKTTIVQLLCELDPNMALIFSSKVSMTEKEVGFSHWLKLMDEKWTGHYHDLDQKHVVPEFYLNLAQHSCPDPLVCSCGYELFPHGQYRSLEEAEATLRQRRHAHFEEVYGSMYPSAHSSHFPLHSIVARVAHRQSQAADDVPETKDGEDPVFVQIVQELKDTRGQKGDIFKPETIADIRFTLASWRRVSTEQNYAVSDSDRFCRSLAYKMACALHKKGAIKVNPTEFVEAQNTAFHW